MSEQHDEPRVVSVYSCRSEIDAHMLVNYLLSKEVPATIGGSPTLVTMLDFDAPTATVDVLVAEEDAEHARRLIADRPARQARLTRMQTQSRTYRVLCWSMIVLFVLCLCVGLMSLLNG